MNENIPSKAFSLDKLRPVLDSVINSGGEFKIISRGTSMLPMLRNGTDTIVLVKKQNALKIGDIPLYKRENGEYVLHRIIGVQKEGYVMRGDNHIISEYPITDSQIIAVLKAYIKDGKRIECSSPRHKFYSFYIMHFMPLRIILKRILRFSKRILKKVKRTFFG